MERVRGGGEKCGVKKERMDVNKFYKTFLTVRANNIPEKEFIKLLYFYGIVEFLSLSSDF